MNKPTVTITIKPHLADFCRHEFDVKEEFIIINRRHDIGKRITSLLSFSPTPVNHTESKNNVEFILPISPKSDLYGKFIYIDKWAEQQINDYISSTFSLYTKLYFERGYKLKYTQKEIILSFLNVYNIKETSLSYEAVKKNDYRNNRRIKKMIDFDIQNNVYQ